MLVFSALSVLHLVAGVFLLAVAMDTDTQAACLYQGRNPLAGDILKYLVITGALTLFASGYIGMGYFVIESPQAAVALAWISLALYLATLAVDAIALKRRPRICKSCAINFSIRLLAAVALTLAFQYGV